MEDCAKVCKAIFFTFCEPSKAIIRTKQPAYYALKYILLHVQMMFLYRWHRYNFVPLQLPLFYILCISSGIFSDGTKFSASQTMIPLGTRSLRLFEHLLLSLPESCEEKNQILTNDLYYACHHCPLKSSQKNCGKNLGVSSCKRRLRNLCYWYTFPKCDQKIFS